MGYIELAIQYPLIYHLILLAVSLLMVIKAADLLIEGAVGFAERFGISDYVTGFLIIGIGTSLPEFISALMGNGLGDSGIVFGTVLGSAVVTVTLILGLEAVVANGLPVAAKALGVAKYAVPLLMALPILLVLDGVLSRIDGAILLAAFVFYLFWLWKAEGGVGRLRHAKLRFVWKHMLVYLGAFAVLIFGARLLVFSAIVTSQLIGLPSYIIALFVIGIGASIGDLAVDLKSIKAGHKQLAVGDVLSGLVVEMLLILGVIALIRPIAIDPALLFLSAGFAVIPLAVFLLIARKELTRAHGIVLLALFLVFSVLQLLAV